MNLGPRQRKNETGRMRGEERRPKKTTVKKHLDLERAPPRTTLAATQMNRQMFSWQILVKVAQVKLKKRWALVRSSIARHKIVLLYSWRRGSSEKVASLVVVDSIAALTNSQYVRERKAGCCPWDEERLE